MIMLSKHSSVVRLKDCITPMIPNNCKSIHEMFIILSFLYDLRELSRWLWSKVLRQELDKYVVFRNGYKSRKDSTKVGPSGCSRNDAFTLHDDYGLRNCLLPLDERQLDIVREIKQKMEGLRPLAFVSDDFDERAQAAYLKLGVTELTFDNAWHVFLALLPQL